MHLVQGSVLVGKGRLQPGRLLLEEGFGRPQALHVRLAPQQAALQIGALGLQILVNRWICRRTYINIYSTKNRSGQLGIYDKECDHLAVSALGVQLCHHRIDLSALPVEATLTWNRVTLPLGRVTLRLCGSPGAETGAQLLLQLGDLPLVAALEHSHTRKLKMDILAGRWTT